MIIRRRRRQWWWWWWWWWSWWWWSWWWWWWWWGWRRRRRRRWWWWWWYDLILIRIPHWICWLGLNIVLLLGLVAGVGGRACRRSKTYCVPNCRRCVDSFAGPLTNLAIVSMEWYMHSAQIIQVSDKCHWIIRITHHENLCGDVMAPKTQRDDNHVAPKIISPMAGHWHWFSFISYCATIYGANWWIALLLWRPLDF